MKRQLIKQMRNEWRSNLWILTELTIVSLVLWGIFTYLYCLFQKHKDYEGYDFTDIYIGYIHEIPETSPSYKEYDENHSKFTDLDELMRRINANQAVEIAGTATNGMPYSYSYTGNELSIDIDTVTYKYAGNCRELSPEAAIAIRMKGVNGETTEQIAEILRSGGCLITPYERESNENEISDPGAFVGKDAYYSYRPEQKFHIGGYVYPMRRNNYEIPVGGTIFSEPSKGWMPDQVVIRIKPGTDAQFIESMKGSEIEAGNVYITNIKSISRMKESILMDLTINLGKLVTGAIFMLVVIFLGFLGTFWFRTQQRVTEIAVRKVNGATDSDIFRRFISEGLILLAIATVAATTIELYFMLTENTLIQLRENTRCGYICMAITATVLALMIIAGIFFPARKAMKTDASQALKDQ